MSQYPFLLTRNPWDLRDETLLPRTYPHQTVYSLWYVLGVPSLIFYSPFRIHRAEIVSWFGGLFPTLDLISSISSELSITALWYTSIKITTYARCVLHIPNGAHAAPSHQVHQVQLCSYSSTNSRIWLVLLIATNSHTTIRILLSDSQNTK